MCAPSLAGGIGESNAKKSASFWVSALLGAVLLVVWFVYRPGLSGSFVFDDFGNLPRLGDYGRVDNWQTLFYYITSGPADPLGRPLSLLTFLIDADSWPADPYSFKRTNVLIHLLNGVLLFALLSKLGASLSMLSRSKARAAALIAAGLWLLHPLWTSTVLYIVQREAMLPGTFILIGLIAYSYARLPEGANRADRPWLFVSSLLLCTVLAVMAKANGILLPIFIATLELVFFRTQASMPAPSRTFSLSLAWTVYPAVVVLLGYLVYVGINSAATGIETFRPWTIGQRLLTEPRVLLEYLGLLAIPRPYSRGLFNDSYVVSTDLLHPWTTTPALLVILSLPALAIAFRKRIPVLAIAVMFFIVGHLLESTTVPLEIYFEHRNYVPAMLLFWPVGLWLADKGALRTARLPLAVGLLLLFAVETHASATLWGEPRTQALVWATKNPDSPRAQSYAASAERKAGRLADAEERLRHAIDNHPDNVQLTVNLLGVRCQRGSVAPSDVASAERALRNGNSHGLILFTWLTEAIEIVHDRTCDGITETTLHTLIDAAYGNTIAMQSSAYRQGLLNAEGRLALSQGDAETAEKKFLESLVAYPTPEAALSQAALLGAAHQPRAALRQLDAYQSEHQAVRGILDVHDMADLHKWLLDITGHWEHETSHMRAVLREDLEAPAVVAPSGDTGHRLEPR